jgi:predicted carbohydrate-binding protein with CBM5 and CBM33 domain
MSIDFFATAVHEPSVWDVWMTTADWDPNTELNWAQMEFLMRPEPELDGNHYTFD